MLSIHRLYKLAGTLLSTGCLLGLFPASSCKEIFERSLDKVNITLTAPGNNVISDSAGQIFYWQPVDSNLHYELQIVTPGFDSVVALVIDTTIDRNIFSTTLTPMQYQWRVRAFNSTSSTAFSVPWNLTIN